MVIGLLGQSPIQAKSTDFNRIINAYYGIKNALVIEDGKAAANEANALSKAVEQYSVEGLSEAQKKTWQEQKVRIAKTATIISGTTNTEKQREEFNELSMAMLTVLKMINPDDQTIYHQYCPMKKASWLSREKEIKNPYYGKRMLNCGSVKEVIK